VTDGRVAVKARTTLANRRPVGHSRAVFWLLTTLPAIAGDLDVEVAVDVFSAASRSGEPFSGPDEVSGTTDLGARFDAQLDELEDRLHVEVDYRGRQPIAGLAPNRPLHLLTEAWASYELVENRFELAAGRFLGDSFQWLPVDGAQAKLWFDDRTWVSGFGGRRAISSSRINLGGFLPAGGLALHRLADRYRFDAMGSYAVDRYVLGTGDTQVTSDQGSFSGLVRTSVQPVEQLRVGGHGALAQRATYVLGPNRADATVEIDSVDLATGVLWASWRPVEPLRVDYDLHGQRGVFLAAGDDGLVDPNFLDNRLRLTGSHKLGVARLDGRLRMRPERQERRFGGSLDANQLGLPGLFARGRLFYDDIVNAEGGGDDVGGLDRGLWSASLGYDRNGLSVEAGASFIERAAVPVSGRVGNTVGAGALTPDDLSPFVLEAQRIGYLRAFWVSRFGFVGTDVERNLGDDEWRVYVQVGSFLETSW